MKQCEYSKYLSDYLEQQLDIQQKKMLEKHLPLCLNCEKVLKELTALKKLYDSVTEEELPRGLHQRIMSQVRKKADKPSGRIVWFRHIAAPMAAALLLFIIGKGAPGIIKNADRVMLENQRRESIVMATPEAAEYADKADDEAVIDGAVTNNGSKELSTGESVENAKDGVVRADTKDKEEAPQITDDFKADVVTNDVNKEITNAYSNIKDYGLGNSGILAFNVPLYLKYRFGTSMGLSIVLTLIVILKRKR